MDWIGTFLGSTRARILRLLRRSGATIAELARALGVSGNAVRAHLAALQRDGLVRDVGAAPTGGKPAQIYDLTPAGEEAFPKAYAVVLEGLIRELRLRRGREATIEILRSVGREAARARGVPPAAPLEARVGDAAEALRTLGGDAEVLRTAGGWEIRGYGCPLSAVVMREADACRLAEGLVAELTGARVSERCDRSGSRPCCVFAVEGANGKG
ncbi:MAG TPA: helix-turn-helix domain-containing protein [Longimicrobiales bacterium]|nr:helix-turn-helix domain-containing protein [Longimicrobiales bacterium]